MPDTSRPARGSLRARSSLAAYTRCMIGGILMRLDRSFIERNRASTNRIRELAARLSDADMQQAVGEHWTVAIALAHLAFWDRRVLSLLDMTERAGRLV